MIVTTIATQNDSELLTVRDVSRRLNCGLQSAYRLLWSGALPSVKVSTGMRRVRPEDLEAFICAKRNCSS